MSTNEATTAEVIRDLMAKWDATRAAWIARFGSDDGFQEWFTAQIVRPA